MIIVGAWVSVGICVGFSACVGMGVGWIAEKWPASKATKMAVLIPISSKRITPAMVTILPMFLWRGGGGGSGGTP